MYGLLSEQNNKYMEMVHEVMQTKNELVQVLKESATKIDDAKNETIQVINDSKNEVMQVLKESATKIDDSKNEVMQTKNELVQVLKESAAKILLISAERDSKCYELEKANTSLLEARSMLNVRGALEFCRAKILSSGKDHQSEIKFHSTVDNVFKNLSNDINFIKSLENICLKKKTSAKYMSHALTTIWNSSSKHFHGREGKVIIRANQFSVNECLVLVALFKHFSISFEYHNKNNEIVDYFDDVLEEVTQ